MNGAVNSSHVICGRRANFTFICRSYFIVYGAIAPRGRNKDVDVMKHIYMTL